jgi:TonB family protein
MTLKAIGVSLAMFRSEVFTLVAAIAFASVSHSQVASKPGEVSSASADEHLLKKVEPVYPPLAKATRIQGEVVLRVTISQAGTVGDVKIQSGHPMLTVSAVAAVKQWQYQPFLVDGHPAEVSTTIEVPFSLGMIPEGDLKKEQQAAASYFKEEDKCRELVHAKQYGDAESSCRTAVELVEKLPTDRQNERRLAYQFLGHSLLFQKKFTDALIPYQKELTIARASLRPYEAELGYAYHDMALALFATGDLQQSHSDYETAISTLEQARDHIESPFLKNEYSGTMKTVLQEYAVLLRRSGDSIGADAAELRAKAIVVRTDLKDQ